MLHATGRQGKARLEFIMGHRWNIDAQRDCGVSIIGDLQKMPICAAGQPALGVLA